MFTFMIILHIIGYTLTATATHLFLFTGVGEEPNLSKKWQVVAHIVFLMFWIGMFLDNIGL